MELSLMATVLGVSFSFIGSALAVSYKIGKQSQKIDGMWGKMEDYSKGFSSVEVQLGKVETKVDDLCNRVGRIEKTSNNLS